VKLPKLELIAFLFFPICVTAAVFVYGNRFGWGDLRLNMDHYAFMVIGSVIAYFLIKKTTLTLGNLSLSLWKGASFKNMPINVLLLRYKISIYFSAVFAIVAFIGGIFYENDLFVLFSWTILGFTVSSQQLLQKVEVKVRENEALAV